MEAKYFKNMEKTRKIFNEMILDKSQLGKYSSSIWLEFCELERQFGDEKHERKLLTRALNELVDDDEREFMYEAAQRFEKLNGSVQQYARVYGKFEAFRARRAAEKEKAAKEAASAAKNNKTAGGKPGAGSSKQQKSQQQSSETTNNKGARSKSNNNETSNNNNTMKRKVNFIIVLKLLYICTEAFICLLLLNSRKKKLERENILLVKSSVNIRYRTMSS